MITYLRSQETVCRLSEYTRGSRLLPESVLFVLLFHPPILSTAPVSNSLRCFSLAPISMAFSSLYFQEPCCWYASTCECCEYPDAVAAVPAHAPLVDGSAQLAIFSTYCFDSSTKLRAVPFVRWPSSLWKRGSKQLALLGLLRLAMTWTPTQMAENYISAVSATQDCANVSFVPSLIVLFQIKVHVHSFSPSSNALPDHLHSLCLAITPQHTAPLYLPS